MFTRRMHLLLVPLCALALGAGACSNDLDIGATKDDARLSRGRDRDGRDLCQLHGWYNDRVCDDFCPQPDPDCDDAPPRSDGGPGQPDGDTPPPEDPMFCGGFAGLPCPEGYECVDDPSDDCDPENGGADCGGICVKGDEPPPPPEEKKFCGGIAGLPCPEGYECVDDPSDDCDPENGGADCGGICVQGDEPPPPPEEPKFCGGIAGFPCPEGYECVDDPRDDCDPENGGADCGGICVPEEPKFCGGIAGFPCPDGYECVDDPRDDCDPENGGADCGGIRVAA